MSAIRHAKIFKKIECINTDELSHEDLVKIVKELQDEVKEEKDYAHNRYKKDYYKDRAISLIRRKINNAKQELKKENITINRVEIYKKKIEICNQMLDCQKEYSRLISLRGNFADRIKVKEIIRVYKQLKIDFKNIKTNRLSK